MTDETKAEIELLTSRVGSLGASVSALNVTIHKMQDEIDEIKSLLAKLTAD
jgi:hypothetical protein